MIGNSLWRNNEGFDCLQGIAFRCNRRSRWTASTAMFATPAYSIFMKINFSLWQLPEFGEVSLGGLASDWTTWMHL
jgi:hypothetical protein